MTVSPGMPACTSAYSNVPGSPGSAMICSTGHSYAMLSDKGGFVPHCIPANAAARVCDFS